MHVVKIENLSAGYNGRPILENFNLTINSGEFLSIIGPNGCGKTTLFKTLMGLLPAKKGTVEIFDVRNPKPADIAAKVGYVPQKISVDKSIPISVREFLDLKKQSPLSKDKVLSIKSTLGIESLEAKPMGILSTGEQQRVFLTFALLSNPSLILLDESLEGVDLGAQTRIYQFLSDLTKSGCAIVLISHDISAVSQWAQRVICLGDGKVFDGDPKSPDFHKCLHQIYGEKSVIHEHRH